ncbi:hypothetical protein CEXT_501971 [Caerostris extrusa]|uniref:Uncharacterized protein n=1 Tax=Caerostris extrusa TaxID=172846 RepID=A0AAV4QWZ0_CAEEX|nr:hypothetical protein CEXT_501971 [Caerostris extrusa]
MAPPRLAHETCGTEPQSARHSAIQARFRNQTQQPIREPRTHVIHDPTLTSDHEPISLSYPQVSICLSLGYAHLGDHCSRYDTDAPKWCCLS